MEVRVEHFVHVARLTHGSRLLNSLYTLEMYRTVLLQRPPNLHPSVENFGLGEDESVASEMPRDHRNISVVDGARLLMCLLSPHKSSQGNITDLNGHFTLCSLAVFSWQSQWRPSGLTPTAPLWKRELLELALHRWKDQILTRSKKLEPWMELFFHMIFVNLFSSATHIHSLIRSQVSGESRTGPLFQVLLAWRRSSDADKAMYHAHAILRLAKSTIMLKPEESTPSDSASTADSSNVSEAPHIATCVYMASLTLWTAAICREPPDTALLHSSVEKGVEILWWLNLGVSKVLSNVLRHLSSAHVAAL